MQIRLNFKEIKTTYTDEEHQKIAKTLAQDGYQAICLFRPEGDVSCLKHYDGLVQGLYLSFDEDTVNMEKIPEYLPNLKALWLRDVRYKKNKYSLKFLHQFKKLDILQADFCRSDIDFLKNLNTVKHLYLSYLKPQQLDAIASLTQLEQLKIIDCTVYNLDFLQSLKNLQTLELESVRKLADLTSVKYLTSLRKFHLEVVGGITSLPDLSHNKQLNAVVIRNLNKLIDINGLVSDSLKNLYIAGLGRELDITPVKEYKTRMPNLKTFCFYQDNKKQTQEACQYIDEDILDIEMEKKYKPKWMLGFFYTDEQLVK